MKRLLLFLFFFVLLQSGIAQKNLLVGAWYCTDSTKATSLVFTADGKVSMQTGAKEEVLQTKNLKEGTYVLQNNMLVIKWSDKTIENNKIKFSDKNILEITLIDKQKLKQKPDFIFARVMDEEISLD